MLPRGSKGGPCRTVRTRLRSQGGTGSRKGGWSFETPCRKVAMSGIVARRRWKRTDRADICDLRDPRERPLESPDWRKDKSRGREKARKG
ncbi:hypothetical protein XENTR_v10010726 [Xenopus tropicalis]|nr:hypothetical protein XENTR_v10020345 [Xenopus tropicalis]KAE8606407.1 hypothetical protein XENTR_v10010726 [Xenopus tropicalis]